MELSGQMVNEEYEPSENDELVLEALKEGRDAGAPWGRANPRWLIDETGLEKGNVEFSLRSLRDAGWVRRVARGLYEFVNDPRRPDTVRAGGDAGGRMSEGDLFEDGELDEGEN